MSPAPWSLLSVLVPEVAAAFDAALEEIGGNPTTPVWRDVVVRDQAGSALYSQGVLLDVTSLRNTEAALRAERDRAQRYLDVADVILLALDADGSGSPDSQLEEEPSAA